MEFTGEVERALRESGWTPERKVEVQPWVDRLEGSGFRPHGVAKMFLSEFGGLTVNVSGPGVSCAREPFELDPMLADGEDDRFSDWSETVGKSIFPIGEGGQGHYFLGIDEEGEIYLVADWLASFGPVGKALEALILGISPTPVEG